MTFEDKGFVGVDMSRSGEQRTLCPKCSSSRKPEHRDEKCCTVNVDLGVWHCHHCLDSGSIHSRIDKEVYKPREDIVIKRYPLSEQSLIWFAGRGIGKETLDRAAVYESYVYFGELKANKRCLCFSQYYGEHLVNAKYRVDIDGKKYFQQQSGGDQIFWGYNDILRNDWCIITEGEIDKLSYDEVGLYSSCSVPSGAPTPPPHGGGSGFRMIYLDRCYTAFKNKKKIYISTDTDGPGIYLRDELIRRLGKDRCYIITYPDGCKDANDVLQQYGAERLQQCFEEAEKPQIEGVLDAKNIWVNYEKLYREGLVGGATTGWRKFDEHLKFFPGMLTMITGLSGHGKSTFLDHLMLKITSNCQWKWAVYSVEQDTFIHQSRLAKMCIGKPFLKDYNGRMNDDEMVAAFRYINENCFHVEPEGGRYTLKNILNAVASLVVKRGINGFILDPWNSIQHPSGKVSDLAYIMSTLNHIRQFTREWRIHTFVVPHPRKPAKEGNKYERPDGYSISGSADFMNITHNGFTVYIHPETKNTEIGIWKAKNEMVGHRGIVEFNFNSANLRFNEVGTRDPGYEIKLEYNNSDNDPGF